MSTNFIRLIFSYPIDCFCQLFSAKWIGFPSNWVLIANKLIAVNNVPVQFKYQESQTSFRSIFSSEQINTFPIICGRLDGVYTNFQSESSKLAHLGGSKITPSSLRIYFKFSFACDFMLRASCYFVRNSKNVKMMNSTSLMFVRGLLINSLYLSRKQHRFAGVRASFPLIFTHLTSSFLST